jgi:flagellar FliJ protein
MSRPFRLAGLLRFRKLQEDQAAADLAVAHAARRAALRRQELAQGQLAEHGFDPVEDTGAWLSTVATRAALRGIASEAGAATELAALEVARREQAWTQTRRQLVPLEKLADKHTEREAVEDLRQEQIVLDEIGSSSTTDDPRDES